MDEIQKDKIEEVGTLEAFSGTNEGVAAAAGRAAPGTALTLAVAAACRDPFAVGALVGHFGVLFRVF